MTTYIKDLEEEKQILNKFKDLVRIYKDKLEKYLEKCLEYLISKAKNDPNINEYDEGKKDWYDDPEFGIFIFISDSQEYIESYINISYLVNPDNRKIKLIIKDKENILKVYELPFYKTIKSGYIYNFIIDSLRKGNLEKQLIIEFDVNKIPNLNIRIMDYIINFIDYRFKYDIVSLKEKIPSYETLTDEEDKEKIHNISKLLQI